jgi:hypothetical protein
MKIRALLLLMLKEITPKRPSLMRIKGGLLTDHHYGYI